MTSRRQFMQFGVAASATVVAGRSALAAGGRTAPAIPIYAVVYDARLRAGVEFGRRSKALGMSTLRFDGDMTAIWYHDIYHRWRGGAVAIAGMTGAGALFCFQQLARDQRMRVIFRAEHQPQSDGRLDHRLTGPASMIVDAIDSGLGDYPFAATMAAVIARCPGPGPATAATARISGKDPVAGPDRESSLWSWVIAPIDRAVS